MPEKIKRFIQEHLEEIILLIGVILISLLSFAIGFIVARQQEKIPLKIEEIPYEKFENSHSWGRDLWTLFSLETLQKGT